MTDTPTSPGHEDPFEIIDSPWGHIEQWRASALATGTMGALAQVYDIVRSDAADAAARADATEARKALVQRLCDQVAALQERVNVLADELEARQRADAEGAARQQAFEEEPLDLPPGMDAEPASSDPSLAPDETHQPSGDLHTLPAKDEEEQLLEPEAGDDMGGVPLSYKKVPLSYVHSAELEEPDHPPVVPQPVAIGFDRQE